jgi:hypothetical protein
MTMDRNKINESDINHPKGNWYLLTGLIFGILFGLVISWVIAPVKYVDTTPSSLRQDFKDEFRAQIASAFYATNNLARAQARLDLLGDPDHIQALTNQAQNLLDVGDPTNTAFLLAYLTSALKLHQEISPDVTSSPSKLEISPTLLDKSTTPSFSGTSLITTPTTTSDPSHNITTPTFKATENFTKTPSSQFKLKSNQTICDSPLKSRLLQVEVMNSTDRPIPGIEIIISWPEGEDHFFTGLKPEISDGYADFLMTPDIVYNLQIVNSGAYISNLTAPICSTENGNTSWGSLQLIFQQP